VLPRNWAKFINHAAPYNAGPYAADPYIGHGNYVRDDVSRLDCNAGRNCRGCLDLEHHGCRIAYPVTIGNSYLINGQNVVVDTLSEIAAYLAQQINQSSAYDAAVRTTKLEWRFDTDHEDNQRGAIGTGFVVTASGGRRRLGVGERDTAAADHDNGCAFLHRLCPHVRLPKGGYTVDKTLGQPYNQDDPYEIAVELTGFVTEHETWNLYLDGSALLSHRIRRKFRDDLANHRPRSRRTICSRLRCRCSMT